MARRIRCPYCGAEYEAPEGVEYAVCPYCGTTVRIETGETAPQYYYPPRLAEHDAYAAALSRASQMPGAPRDLQETAAFSRAGLHMVPLYICHASARAREESCRTAAEEAEEAALATGPEPLPGLPQDYPFPSTGRVPYSPGVVERVERFHQATRPPGDLCRALEMSVSSRAFSEAMLSGCSGEVEASSRLLGVAHYPFWVVHYTHPLGKQPYTAVVDAVDATVVYVEYPVPGSRRLTLLGLAAAGYAAGLAAGAAVAAYLHAAGPLLGAAAVAAASAAPHLRRAAARRGRYRLSASTVPASVTRLMEERTE